MKNTKNILATVAIAVAVVAGSLAWAESNGEPDSGPWFDMEKCACCKHMGEAMDMMTDIQWENHLIENGGMMTAVIPEQHKKRWDVVCEKMQGVETELAAGKQLEMCNFCQSYAGLVGAGAKVEDVQTGFGSVTLVTSDNQELVEQIHAHFKRTQAEYEKMIEQ